MDRLSYLHDHYEKLSKDVGDFIFPEGNPQEADIIFVPGNGYPDMAERAAELYALKLAPFVLPSGKYSITNGRFGGVLKKEEKYGKDFESEWEFLKTVLMKNGVPEKAILKENEASYTYQNALLSRKVTEQSGLEIRKALLCCKNYHAGRALMYYQTVFPETEFIVCPVSVDGITKENWRKSPEGIREVTAELEKIILQFSLYM